MRPADTTANAEAVQRAVYRRMTVGQRLHLALEMSEAAWRTSLDGIRARHPEYDAATAVRALFRLVHGDELCAKAWPREPFVAP